MFDCLIISELIFLFYCQLCWYRSQGIVTRSADTSIQDLCAWTDDQIDGGDLL